MGWYHVERKGKGMNLSKFSLPGLLESVSDEWIPDSKWIQSKYPGKVGEYDSMTKGGKLIYLGCLEDMAYFFRGPNRIEELTAELADSLFDNEDDRVEPLLNAIALIYAYHYGYPTDAFVCVSDYNHDWMFYCVVSYPPREYNETLAKLTEAVFGAQLSEFLTQITGISYDERLEICEEYQKW